MQAAGGYNSWGAIDDAIVRNFTNYFCDKLLAADSLE
jgi:hypothetical protein